MKKILTFSILLIITILGLDFFMKSGTYWFLDSIFYPISDFKSFFSQSIYWHFRDILTMIVGYQFYSKILMLSTIILGVFLGYKISKLVFQIFDISENKTKELLSIISISFLLINPFIYERTVTQLGIAIAIYLIGLGLVYLIKHIINSPLQRGARGGDNIISSENKARGAGLYFSSLFFALALTIMPHTAVFLVIIFITTLVFFYKKFSIKNIIISILIVLFINFNWIFGSLFLGENKTIENVKSFNELNIDAFTTNKLYGSVEFSNMLLYGFWPEKYNNRLLIPDSDLWVIAGLIIFGIIIYGFINLYKKNKKLSLYLLSLGIIGFVLGTSISSNLFGWISEILYKYLPGYIGMREPQKLTGLLMIVYSIFFVIGVYDFLENFRKKEVYKKYFSIAFIFILLIIWSPNVLFSYNGQLVIQDYPKDILKSKEYLLKHKEKNILILPWHSYTACLWTKGKVIANPLQYILRPIKTISADNIEIENLYTNSNNSRTKKIEEFLKTKDFDILKNINIDTIYFTDYCADYPKYKFLKNNKNLELVFNSQFIKVYKIK